MPRLWTFMMIFGDDQQGPSSMSFKTERGARLAASRYADKLAEEGCKARFEVHELVADGRNGRVPTPTN